MLDPGGNRSQRTVGKTVTATREAEGDPSIAEGDDPAEEGDPTEAKGDDTTE